MEAHMRYREQRLPCDTGVVVLLDGVPRLARLVNIGATGGRVEGLGQVPQGASVTLEHVGTPYPAVVIWSNPRQAGLRFGQRLSTAQVAALRKVGAPTGEGWVPSGPGAYREMA
jgi:hypothetical protein